MVFLGEQFSLWQSPSVLLPYRPYQAEKAMAASEQKLAGKMPRYTQFQQGLEVRANNRTMQMCERDKYATDTLKALHYLS